ncbi:MAG: hypothetical protein LUF90_02530 [Rikenellaceae bacterium]|nr:hypothetical protein [Rikenellaceae bacterium]
MKRYYYPKRDFSIPESLLTGYLSNVIGDRPSDDALFWEMWNECQSIADAVLQTDYFKGIVNANLHPAAFGSLMVQDAYYCMKGRDDYSAAVTHALDDKCKEFMQRKVDSYDNYNVYYHKTWHIREAQSIIPGKEIKDYADYEAYVAGNLESPYVFCVMLPCEYLWNWVANQIDDSVPAGTIYRFWVDSNRGEPTGGYQMANILEDYRSQINESKAKEIFKKAMNYELEVFTASTKIDKLWEKK